MPSLDLSLIIPCYNELAALKENTKQIIEVLNSTRFSYEIIFVDDCSTNDTVELIKEIINEHPDVNISAVFHKQNEGRGKAVADGILTAQAKIAGFIDIDLSISASYIPSMVMEIVKGADIAIALRVYKLSWHSVPRWIISKGYSLLVKLFLRLELNDTETGCKFFNRERIMPILAEIRDTHWFWDTEIMVRSYLKGFKIIEIPSVFIRSGFYSKVKIFRDSIQYFINLVGFRRELKRRRLLGKHKTC